MQSGPLERRATRALTGLTLRSAIGLIVGVATVLSVGAAILVRLIDPAIGTFGDSLWWAVTTVSTVGYGDVVPESASGRVVGAVLMLTGLSLIPVITSVAVSILVAQRSREAREEEARDIREVLSRLDRIEQRLGS
jgi:voltage-gated potassium channel